MDVDVDEDVTTTDARTRTARVKDRARTPEGQRMIKYTLVSVISVTEYVDDSPASFVTESVLQVIAAWYSKNLAQEVAKGRKEARWRGGGERRSGASSTSGSMIPTRLGQEVCPRQQRLQH